MKTTAYIDMSVTSKTVNVLDLSEILKMPAQHHHNIGDKSKNGQDLDYSQYNYYSDHVELFYTSELTKRFCQIIEPKLDVLKEYIIKNNCTVSFCIVISKLFDSPCLDLSPEFIKLMAELNASFSFDNVYLI